ncbi:spindle and kinetochore-associated protein 1-like [Ctenocephalides felis]|uniref:spindle and kinetochore-associated protein 1-like n=1 Tax=Ctenocephalides felis TaxID=7515 RepID=UPI000E6E30A2|nr:spindle and kinetochore-associated protein 1-like [Ctenocephalides felis]
MSELVQIYQPLRKKLELIELSIKLSSCSEQYKRDFEIKLRDFQRTIEEIKQLAHDNVSIQEQLRDKLKILQENRKSLDQLRRSKPVVIEINSSCANISDTPNLNYLSMGENRHNFELSPINQSNLPVLTPVSRKISFDGVPEISFIEPEEFDSIPQYMRGRQNVEALNKFIKRINEAVYDKYTLIKLPRNQVSKDKLKLYLEYKRLQATTDKHLIFITASDLGLKLLDKQTNNFFAMLRHVKRIKEMRDGGVTKICLLNTDFQPLV